MELLTGVAFLGCWLQFGDPNHRCPPALALVYAIFLAGLICATFIDFEHFIIPDEITLGGIVAGFAFSFLLPQLHDAASIGFGFGAACSAWPSARASFMPFCGWGNCCSAGKK